ncbi:hypothetical protein GGU10DRAFT_435335 [Lentinula aff. detonsa]|uniref:Uncharacterized protein n=1 Tax=Lentinula aff. detonsa TaxID=2804958 RepID=A0AA38KVJ8_9AGAR|nr:hypothetical protein GGU10DRAFT_435335 [Lentinula aff. detonsa]
MNAWRWHLSATIQSSLFTGYIYNTDGISSFLPCFALLLVSRGWSTKSCTLFLILHYYLSGINPSKKSPFSLSNRCPTNLSKQYRAMRLDLAYLTLGLASAAYAIPVANIVPSDHTSSPVQAIVARAPRFSTKVHPQYLFPEPFGKATENGMINNPTANAAVETVLKSFGLTDEPEALNDYKLKKLLPDQQIPFLIVSDAELPTTSTSKSPALSCPCEGTVMISIKDGRQIVTGTLTSTRVRESIDELNVDDKTLQALIKEEVLNKKTLVAEFTPHN